MELPTTLKKLHALCKLSPTEVLLAQLCDWGLIPPEGSLNCPQCGHLLRLGMETASHDGRRWYCNGVISHKKRKRTKCCFKLGFRKGTFFEGSSLDMYQILGFVHFWVKNVALSVIGSELRISAPACVNWAVVCREVLCVAYLLHPERLGGSNMVVDIDEAKFEQPQYYHGRHFEGQWMYTAYERGTGKVVIVAVKERDADLLVPIIQHWILPGTTLISDIWRTHNCLENEEYRDLMVNQRIAFKDADASVGKDSIESDWRVAKSTKDSQGRIKAHLCGNLSRYIFFKRCRDQKLDRTREFFRLAGILYDPRRLAKGKENTEPLAASKCKNDNDEDDAIDFDL